MKGCFTMMLKREKEYFIIRQGRNMWGSSAKTLGMDKEYTILIMETYMKDNL